ncbi:DUF3159 domain-containing protein [Amnibacterium flavum]|uniref:DUF3159 domain-containing protein n=1 Tax=Amnibacterium flavum TaxID=2173173 RepID=A0A2V1HRM0_9MICO|nr:DUF3159 domain-containing protein [Amnibacterium flavum]PVZ94302.1 DUF3159 domain-containing protein [Amnibacterium flavum]
MSDSSVPGSAGSDRPDERAGGEPSPAADRTSDEVPETFRQSLAEAARRAGFGQVADGGAVTGRGLLSAIGGVRGVLEAVLPGVLFVVLFSVTRSLPLSLGISVGAAAVFTVVRIAQRTPVTQAIGGLFAALASAGLSLFTGRAEDNFVLGLITNGAYGAGLLISVLVGWPLIGVAVGYLFGEGTAWRKDRRKFRAMQGLTLAWVALFAARLAVQLPLYLSGSIELLGTLKLVMGLPLYAPLLVLSWLVARAVFRTSPTQERPGVVS